MTRVAAIDCGTNSIRLLVADAVDGRLTDLTREMRVVKLGQGVDKTGEFATEALERTFAALDDYAATCRSLTVDRIRFVATSATRFLLVFVGFVHRSVRVGGTPRGTRECRENPDRHHRQNSPVGHGGIFSRN